MSDLKNVPFTPPVLPAAGMRICGEAPTGCTTAAERVEAMRRMERARIVRMRVT
jgi:hypothetical protein